MPIESNLTAKQLEIMKVMWQLGKGSVRDVYEALRAQRAIAYTTVMTTMKTIESSGRLKRGLRDTPISIKRSSYNILPCAKSSEISLTEYLTGPPNHCWLIWSRSVACRKRIWIRLSE